MKTKNYFTHYEQTILNSIDLEAYDIDTSNMNNFDKITEVYSIFVSEYIHANNKNQDRKVVFKDWLQGLPSVLTIPFSNYEILKNAKKEGFNLDSELMEDNFLEMYWQNCADAFFTLYNNL